MATLLNLGSSGSMALKSMHLWSGGNAATAVKNEAPSQKAGSHDLLVGSNDLHLNMQLLHAGAAQLLRLLCNTLGV